MLYKVTAAIMNKVA